MLKNYIIYSIWSISFQVSDNKDVTVNWQMAFATLDNQKQFIFLLLMCIMADNVLSLDKIINIKM